MTSVMPWWEGGGKSVTQMLQILTDADVKGERLHYLQVSLYSFKKCLEWKWTGHLAGKRALFTIAHWPWIVHHNYNGNTVSKSTLTLDLPFLYFSGETHEKVPAFLPAEVTRKHLIDFCGVQEQRKRRTGRETGRERGRLLSTPPVIWLSSLGRERAACWLREAAEKIHLMFSPCGAYQTHISPPLRGLWQVSNWCHMNFAMDRKGTETRKSRERGSVEILEVSGWTD